MKLARQREEFLGFSDSKYAIREKDRIPKSSWFVCRAVLRSRALRMGRKFVNTRGSACGAAPRRPSLGPPECNCFVPCRDRHCCRGPLRIPRWQKKRGSAGSLVFHLYLSANAPRDWCVSNGTPTALQKSWRVCATWRFPSHRRLSRRRQRQSLPFRSRRQKRMQF